MIKYHFIETSTMEYHDQDVPSNLDLIEACFLYSNRREKHFTIKGFLHGEGGSIVDPELTTEEKTRWLLDLLFDEFQKVRAEDKESKEFEIYFLNDEDKPLGILVIRDGQYKVHVVYPYTDLTEDPMTYWEQCEEMASQRANPRHVLRFHMPVLWNETLKKFNVYRHGDKCRVRFIYPYKEILWNGRMLNRVRRALKELNDKDDVWKPLKFRD